MGKLKQAIATEALYNKPVKKKEAFDALLSIIDKVEGLPNSGEFEKDLIKLYPFFTPPLPKKPKTPEDWVKLAVAKNDIRLYMNSWWCLNDDLVATDGKRLHLYTGYHKFNSETTYDKSGVELDTKDLGKFPDYKRVIPSSKGRVRGLLSDFVQKPCILEGNPVIEFYDSKGFAFRVPQKSLQDAVCVMVPENTEVLYNPKDSYDSVLFTCGYYSAVLMGVRS